MNIESRLETKARSIILINSITFLSKMAVISN